MASISYNDAGTWRTITAPAYKDGATWRNLTAVHYNDAGTWRQVFGGGANAPALSTPQTVDSNFNNAAVWMLKSTGSLETTADLVTTPVAGEWLTISPDSPTAALYEVRRTQGSGTLGITFTGTMTSGVWFPLNADRGISIVATLGIARQNVSLWEIRLIAGPGPIVASATVTVSSTP